MEGTNAIVIIGGKNSPLTSSQVRSIVNSVAQLSVEPSSLSNLSSDLPPSPTLPKDWKPQPTHFPLTLEESRASLVVLLHKLLLTATGIRRFLPGLITQTLNRGFDPNNLDFGSAFGFFDSLFQLNGRSLLKTRVTDGELFVFHNSGFVSIGICAVMDYSSSSLSTVVDAVAALSCEALKADVSRLVTNSVDVETVTKDFAVLLRNSELINKVNSSSSSDHMSISRIPEVHGSFRDVVKSVHSRVEVSLNTGVSNTEDGDYGLRIVFSSLAISLFGLGECSCGRVGLLLNSNEDFDNVSALDDRLKWFEGFKDNYGLVFNALTYLDYVKFFHEMYVLLCGSRYIVAWEVALALLVLNTNEITEKGRVGVTPSLGMGTAIIRKILKDRLETRGAELDISEKKGLDDINLTASSVSSEDLRLLFNPVDKGHDEFLDKVQVITWRSEGQFPLTPKEIQTEIKLPHNYENIIKISDTPINNCSTKELLDHLRAGVFLDRRRKKYWIDESSRNCFTMFPRDLYMYWGHDSKHMRWIQLKDTTTNVLYEVGEPLNDAEVDVQSRFYASSLSPETRYEVVFTFMMKDQVKGWDGELTFVLHPLPDGKRQAHKKNISNMKKQQWIDIKMGEFDTSNFSGELYIQMHMWRKTDKSGLVIKGFTIRPIDE